MEAPRWLVDEMLGRLARYLRFVGCDTVYATGLDDDEILRRAEAEGRRLVTRDRALAARRAGSVLVRSPKLAEQWRELRAAEPAIPTGVAFARCTKCNGPLVPYRRGTDPERETGVPAERPGETLALFACAACAHLYWEGGHTRRIRATLASWESDRP